MGVSVAVSAGEASGDLNGAHLVCELNALRPGLSFWGAGGPKMRQAGVRIAVDTTGGGTISISETVKTAPVIVARYFRMRWGLLRRRPDLFIPIDFGAFNIRLGQIAHKNGIPVVYYFPPSSWRRRPRNAPRLLACGGKVITPFPWSAEVLRAAGVDARFVGHPLLDVVKPSVGREDFLNEFGLRDSVPIIGLLPGSRSHELSEHLGPMIGCAETMDRELGGAQFVIGAANRIKVIQRAIDAAARGKKDFPTIRIVQGRTYDCMAHSDFLVAKSGTATLEAAILGTPMLIVYRGTGIMRLEFLFRKSVLEDFIGMPNIVADRGVCPELINEDVTAEKLADISLGIMRDEGRLLTMRRELGEVRKRLGEPGAVTRAARAAMEMGGLA